jgi:hypothetical protein
MKTIQLILSAVFAFSLICAPFQAMAADPTPVPPDPNAQYPQQPWPADFKKILSNPPQDMMLYSLEPLETPEKGEEALQGYKVLGKMFMRPEVAQAAVGAFQDAIEKWDSKKAKCFKPRQALVVNDGGHKYEILLCYSCQQMFAFRDGVQVRSYGVAGSPKVLKDILRKADKPISKTDPKT